MKSNLRSHISIFALSALALAFAFGCSKNQAPQTPVNNSAIVSATKTSFSEVTSQLDPGGNFYLYLGTAQWLENLSAKTEKWHETFNSMPDLTDEKREEIDQSFNVLDHVIQDSGIQDLSGVGASSIEIEQGLYRNKAILHHYPDKGDGFLWNLCGRGPVELDGLGLDLLPTDTALAMFTELDAGLLWNVAQKEAANSGIPGATDQLQKLPAQFEEKTGIKWDQFLNSLGGEWGLVLTLDSTNTVTIPYPPTNPMTIPAPGLMLVVKVNDDTIFNRIDQALKGKPLVTAVDKPDFKMRTMLVPLPLPIQLRPSSASSAGYLFIASSDELIQKALDVKNGKQPGLEGTDEFKRLSQHIQTDGNQFFYVSSLFGQTIVDIQKQAMANAPGKSAQAQWAQSLFQSHPAYAYSVGVNTSEGLETIGNSSQSYATAAILPAVAVGGMLTAIAVPNFVKARETSQRNACINNLRRIDAAKQEWALEKNKTNGDIPTKEDLMPYIGRWPVCPSGGTYSINPIGEPPTCSFSGHKLPESQ
jgi:hypothetical protein